MNDIRARFEEIWPVPDHVEWHDQLGRYEPTMFNWQTIPACDFYNIRLDTFTSCQETTDMYLTLIEDLVYDLGRAYNHLKRGTTYNTYTLDRAKKIMEQNK